MFEVKKNIPIPKKIKTRWDLRYPFGKMDVGDSFFIDCKPEELFRTKKRVTSSISSFGMRHKMKFTLREVKNGLGCWRIK